MKSAPHLEIVRWFGALRGKLSQPISTERWFLWHLPWSHQARRAAFYSSSPPVAGPAGLSFTGLHDVLPHWTAPNLCLASTCSNKPATTITVAGFSFHPTLTTPWHGLRRSARTAIMCRPNQSVRSACSFPNTTAAGFFFPGQGCMS